MNSISKHSFFTNKSLFIIITMLGIAVAYKLTTKPTLLKKESPIVVDFDHSMHAAQFPEKLEHEEPKQFYQLCKKLYEKHNFSNLTPSTLPRIPKLIHIIWLGGKLPTQYEQFVKSWYTHHPDWTIFFWTDNSTNYDKGTRIARSFEEVQTSIEEHDKHVAVDITTLSFDNRMYYDEATNYGERSDILKWEIVYRFGGVYVDIDFECLKPLDIFHHYYDFYTGLQPMDTSIIQLGAALFAARPGHPILKRCVEDIKNNRHIKQIVHKTGPLHFTRSLIQESGKHSTIDIVFPASYFYPCMYHQKNQTQAEWIQPESYAIHHWAGSWLKAPKKDDTNE